MLALAPRLAGAQQQPTYGCRVSVSCMPLGFSTINGNFGTGASMLFGAGFRWGPGFEFYIAGPQDIVLAAKPTPAADGQLFHLRLSLLAPPPIPPPAPTPHVAPPPAEPPKN
jgi:hypothetical protein